MSIPVKPNERLCYLTQYHWVYMMLKSRQRITQIHIGLFALVVLCEQDDSHPLMMWLRGGLYLVFSNSNFLSSQ